MRFCEEEQLVLIADEVYQVGFLLWLLLLESTCRACACLTERCWSDSWHVVRVPHSAAVWHGM